MAIWAEIKKTINSNLQKPLNTLIDERINDVIEETRKRQIAGAINVVSNKHTIGQTITALDITGSGVLYFAVAYGYMKSSGITSVNIQVIVDDETILNGKLNHDGSVSTAYARMIGVADPSVGLFRTDNKYTYLTSTNQVSVYGHYTYIYALNLSPNLQTFGGYMESAIGILKNGLRFNRNLKVIITSTGSAGSTSEIVASSIGYILD